MTVKFAVMRKKSRLSRQSSVVLNCDRIGCLVDDKVCPTAITTGSDENLVVHLVIEFGPDDHRGALLETLVIWLANQWFQRFAYSSRGDEGIHSCHKEGLDEVRILLIGHDILGNDESLAHATVEFNDRANAAINQQLQVVPG